MHTLLILEIIFYAIALLLFIAPITTFIKRGMGCSILLRKTNVRHYFKKP